MFEINNDNNVPLSLLNGDDDYYNCRVNFLVNLTVNIIIYALSILLTNNNIYICTYIIIVCQIINFFQ